MTVIKKTLYIKDIKVKTRQRRQVNYGVVNQIALGMKNGIYPPAIEVDCNLVLIAGYHRLLAHKQIKRLQIEARIHSFTYNSVDGKDLEFDENAKRLELSKEERDEGLRAFAKRHPDLTKQQIADKYGYNINIVVRATKNSDITRSRTSNSYSNTNDNMRGDYSIETYDMGIEEPINDAVPDADTQAEAEAEEQHIRRTTKQKSSIPDNPSYKIELSFESDSYLKQHIEHLKETTGDVYKPEEFIRRITALELQKLAEENNYEY